MVWPFRRSTIDADESRSSLIDESALAIFSADAAAELVVNHRTALRCTAVYAAVRTLAEIMASLSIHCYRRLDEGKERADDHPAETVVAGFANAWTTAVAFREQMTVDLMLHGNAFAWIGRTSRNRVTELQRLDPAAVKVDRDGASLEPFYVVGQKDGSQRRYSFREILHLRGLSTDDLTGESPILLAKEAIRLALVLEKHGVKFFEQGARPSGVVTAAKTLGLTPEGAQPDDA